MEAYTTKKTHQRIGGACLKEVKIMRLECVFDKQRGKIDLLFGCSLQSSAHSINLSGMYEIHVSTNLSKYKCEAHVQTQRQSLSTTYC